LDQLRANDPRQLGGYTLVGRLGEGGQGTVYAARTPAGIPVAIKLLRADLADDPAARARFVKELAASARVGPACTARVLEADVEGARPYVVSEYVDGPSLQALVAERGPLSGAELTRLAVGMLIALEAVHAAGIVHRDFKPANVLVDANGPRVIDFGIARALDATATLTSKVIGTPAYMAPEQFTADSVPAGPAADMFAWAATVAYAATGRAPFGSDSVPQVMHRILYSAPDLSGIPNTPLLRVLTRCLQKDPRQRPTVREARAELAVAGPVGPSDAVPGSAAATAPGLPGGGAPGGPSSSRPTGGGRARPRRRVMVAASSALGIALAGVLIWAGVNFLPLDLFGTANDGHTSGPPGSSPSTGMSTPPHAARPAAGTILPGTSAEVVSDLDGDVSLTSYSSFETSSAAGRRYLWNGETRKFEPLLSATALRFLRTSPDGRWVAGGFSFKASADQNYATLIDRSNLSAVPKIIRPPDNSMRLSWMEWSPDGKHLLILVIANDAKNPETKGLLLVMPERSLEGTLLPLKDRSTFSWLPGSVGFAVNVDTVDLDTKRPDIEFYNLQGTKHDVGGEFPEAGWLGTSGYGAFSPNGQKLVTMCNTLDKPAMVCVYDMEQTVPVTFQLDTDEKDPLLVPIGFYDDTHLIADLKDESAHSSTTVVLDLDGRQVKTLVSNPDEIPLQFSVSP
jgi:eukaryotic-like serine/threonine-protein kinase